MIPADVVSRLQTQTTADATLQPAAPAQALTDKLSDLVAGQRVMAEIQAVLPNGTYRALINQRSITLALPFSAQTGDSLELLVTESDGQVALAVVSHKQGENASAAKDGAVATTLSRTGQFIGQLLGNTRQAKDDAPGLILNGNRPIADAPPTTAQDILPQLKQALTQSGMFYESHQASWVEGRVAKNVLLQEPQGKLSSPAAFAAAAEEAALPPNVASPNVASPASTTPDAVETPPQTLTPTATRAPTDSAVPAGQLIAPQTQPVVQQQLVALASQNFVWQGQVWPGQDMRWEIEEDASHRQSDGGESADNWNTRLQLSLPNLGGVNTRLQLHGNELVLAITADSTSARTLMQTESETLRQQLQAAGLALTSIGISEEAEPTAQENAEE
ncbi:flagellar hook-length control protein FliK [Propionivibrio limicola]|uniref:flagellar hook-length control protein FliK n=1 Tax=Propionivibrio limicola TaxID=167645 RepID=UPI0012923F39|nr:flagellar hook-length control protein FliK [Propionivibrio limicola]